MKARESGIRTIPVPRKPLRIDLGAFETKSRVFKDLCFPSISVYMSDSTLTAWMVPPTTGRLRGSKPNLQDFCFRRNDSFRRGASVGNNQMKAGQ
jgi:hypothetical protein